MAIMYSIIEIKKTKFQLCRQFVIYSVLRINFVLHWRNSSRELEILREKEIPKKLIWSILFLNPPFFFRYSDIAIARNQTPKNIMDLASEVGLSVSEVDPYGSTKAKVNIKVLERLANKPSGKYVIVCG